jgi:hypothetical protein
MTGKSLNKRHKINDKESNNKYVRFYPFIHLTWYQKVSSTIINLQK